MKAVIVALALSGLSVAGAQAQPLEQNFAFGAPLSVLGNDRFQPRRLGGLRPALRHVRPADVSVRLGRNGHATRDRRWN